MDIMTVVENARQGQPRIGCGIAGFTDNEISPLFEKAHDVENIVLPPGW